MYNMQQTQCAFCLLWGICYLKGSQVILKNTRCGLQWQVIRLGTMRLWLMAPYKLRLKLNPLQFLDAFTTFRRKSLTPTFHRVILRSLVWRIKRTNSVQTLFLLHYTILNWIYGKSSNWIDKQWTEIITLTTTIII